MSDVPYHELFSSTYMEARHRFLEAARRLDAELLSYPMPEALGAGGLAIDVAAWGPEDQPTVLLSSGIHGVEGFFGSAVQLGLLQHLRSAGGQTTSRYVLIHALNPYGFAHLRRCNEDNVDLNRNFLAHGDDYVGAPLGYAELNALLNPATPPTRWEPFLIKACWQIARGGMAALKEAVARGQYEYPRGLFYGGAGPCWSTRIVQRHCRPWLGRSERILHVDFHSGLGARAQYRLLTNERLEAAGWYQQAFGKEYVESLIQPGGTAYPISGLFGAWMQRNFQDRIYRFVGAEFGTYGVLPVLAAIRAENRAAHYCATEDRAYRRAKRDLLECFCPRAKRWRSRVVASGLRIVEQAATALLVKTSSGANRTSPA